VANTTRLEDLRVVGKHCLKMEATDMAETPTTRQGLINYKIRNHIKSNKNVHKFRHKISDRKPGVRLPLVARYLYFFQNIQKYSQVQLPSY
jgi:hypothetical protein